jgi:hypothetical protein
VPAQRGTIFLQIIKKIMAKTAATKSGPKDKSYVNSKEKYEKAYEPKRKTPAKKFGKGKSA